MELEIVQGNIATTKVDVLVTAANHYLGGGGGVDAAIHRAAGPRLLEAIRPLAPCAPGQAVITPAFDIPAPVGHVVHAVGPRYGVDHPADQLLASAYTASLRLCDEVGAHSVAFPLLSAGAFGYPVQEACEVSFAALSAADTRVGLVILVAFDVRTMKLWTRAARQRG